MGGGSDRGDRGGHGGDRGGIGGVDITDFFNYGFNEDTWKYYVNKVTSLTMKDWKD